MSLERSPSLDQFKDGMPDKLPDHKKQRNIRWVLMIAILVIGAGWGALTFLQSNAAAVMSGTGSISGSVTDENGKPVAAQIYVLGTNISGQALEDGSFSLEDVPAGQQTIAIAHQGSGFEVPAQIRSGENTLLGQVQYTSTLEPQQ